jgi:hypothetical protein
MQNLVTNTNSFFFYAELQNHEATHAVAEPLKYMLHIGMISSWNVSPQIDHYD